MKISTLIAEITREANARFGRHSGHTNDVIQVNIAYCYNYTDGDEYVWPHKPEWFVSLIRNSQAELDRGEVFYEDEGSTNLVEDELGIRAEGHELLPTLLALRDNVNNADSWDD